MKILKRKKTSEPIRRPLRISEHEGKDFYVKPDPDFTIGTYSVCHRQLRKIISPGDILFFRTLWRGRQYFIGFFVIKGKRGPSENPTLFADLEKSMLIHFRLPISLDLARLINPETDLRGGVHANSTLNGRLGRNYKRIDTEVTRVLIELIEANKTTA